MKLLARALALALIAAPAAAADKYPDVRDTSSVDASGVRVLQLSIDLNAPAKAVWDAYTDPQTVTRWMASLALIDLKQGGSMEESYTKGAKAGDEENIRHEIIAYVPGQMLVFRNTHAPSMLQGRELYKRVVSVLEVRDLGAGRSRLVLSQAGFAPGPDFDRLYSFFTAGDSEEMEDLKAALENPKGVLHLAGK